MYRGLIKIIITVAVLDIISAPTFSHPSRYDPLKDKYHRIERSLILDGSCVHNIGNLQMNITNWGFLGSLPKSNYPMADLPSAQWPAGSGIEYLYAAGIWVGAKINGVPMVSTGYPEMEFYPGRSSRDVIYSSFEGDECGYRHPSPIADDDGDGMVDEEWLNGYDDDGDGLIDEDFAAYGSQMYFCQYSDDQGLSRVMWPEHEPLHIRVRQQTFQWGERSRENFIAVHYYITNTGNRTLDEVYVGLYADLDAGPRNQGNYHMEDMLGSWAGERCASKDGWEWPVVFDINYVYDANGDKGRTPGYFGIVTLRNRRSWVWTYVRSFRGLQPFISKWGEPTNDYERYQAMSNFDDKELADIPGDYRILISRGPYMKLPPGETIHLNLAFAAGDGLEELLDNAAQAVLAFEGNWFDLDGDPKTGVKGREYPFVPEKEPAYGIDPDPCDSIIELYDVAVKETLWCNFDCYREHWLFNHRTCIRKPGAKFKYFQTGVDGKEHHLPWTVDAAPVPPEMRLIPGNGRIAIIWNNVSETASDLMTGLHDFEGYQIWRADDWRRPTGTTRQSGPGMDLWSMLDERDIINGVPPDKNFKSPLRKGGWEYEPCSYLEERQSLIQSFEENLRYSPGNSVPCPPGIPESACDTLEALARFNLGLEGGMQYYKFVDHTPKNGMHYFYSVVAYDHAMVKGEPSKKGWINNPSVNFKYISPRPESQKHTSFDQKKIYVVPNPVTTGSMKPWTLSPTNRNPSGTKLEFRHLPACLSTIRIFTLAGDLVQVLTHDGEGGNGSCPWDLVTRNGQDITSGIYIFQVDPEDERFQETIGKFVVIR